MLPQTLDISQSASVALQALYTWKQFWFCVVPTVIAIIASSIFFGQYIIALTIVGFYFLTSVIFLIMFFCCRNSFQLWALQRPQNLISRYFMPGFEVLESYFIGDTTLMMQTAEKWGLNFCASGEVWLGTYKDVSDALTNPQARSFNLGEHPLLPSSLPDSRNGRCVFLLALSNKGAGGTGDHEAFRQCLIDHIFTPEAKARETDAVSRALVDQFAQDFTSMSYADFYIGEKGNQEFWMKYLHHVLFDLDINDESVLTKLRAMFIGAGQLLHYFLPAGHIISYHSQIDAVADLYENSKPFKNFKVSPAYHNMTRRELAVLMVSIIRIAGVQGSGFLSWLAMSGSNGNLTIDPSTVWDTLNLSDKSEVRRYILECARLSNPVTVSHRVSAEEFTCLIAGSKYTFPKGTKIAIPLALASIDTAAWGPTALDFDHNRPDLEQKSIVFNSVNGAGHRECPGKELALSTVTRLLQETGKLRRTKTAKLG